MDNPKQDVRSLGGFYHSKGGVFCKTITSEPANSGMHPTIQCMEVFLHSSPLLQPLSTPEFFSGVKEIHAEDQLCGPISWRREEQKNETNTFPPWSCDCRTAISPPWPSLLQPIMLVQPMDSHDCRNYLSVRQKRLQKWREM